MNVILVGMGHPATAQDCVLRRRRQGTRPVLGYQITRQDERAGQNRAVGRSPLRLVLTQTHDTQPNFQNRFRRRGRLWSKSLNHNRGRWSSCSR